MPKIPDVPKTTSSIDIGSSDHALAVARVLGGTSKREDTSRFLAVIRKCLRERKDIRKLFLEWYEEVPASDEDEDRPRKKKKKKVKDEDNDE